MQYLTTRNRVVDVPKFWSANGNKKLWYDEGNLAEFVGQKGPTYRLDNTILTSVINGESKESRGERQIKWPPGLEKFVKLRIKGGKGVKLRDRRKIDQGPADWSWFTG